MNSEKMILWMKKYADVLINFGVNIQRGQKLVLILPQNAREFGLQVVEAAYEAGSGHVAVYYLDNEINRIKQKKATWETLGEIENTIEKALGKLIDEGAAILFLVGDHPEALVADTNEKRKSIFLRSFTTSIGEIQNRRRSISTNSCLAFFPTEEYSSYLFPEKSPHIAQEFVINILTPILKLDSKNPVLAWKEHNSHLKKRANLLNTYAFDSLLFQGGGTDLHISLVQNHIWQSASPTAKNGIECAFNFPSEELFTAPDWSRAEGSIRSTRKIFMQGIILDKVELFIKDGKIINEESDGSSKLLLDLLNTDDRSRYLGEVALVSEDSPIALQPMSLKNLLFDENSGCHIAFGTSYPNTLKNGLSMTKEELIKAGMNVSKQHIDLIIGSKELSVTGITQEGKMVNILTEGLWTDDFQ